MRPMRTRPHMGPLDMGGWGPPPPGGWGPPPHPEDWGPPPPGGWPLPPEEWGPPPPGGWGPPPPGGWGPRESGGWGPRGPSPPPGWGLHLEDWRPPHPEDWRPPHPEDWRAPHPDDWRAPHPEDWRPPHPEDWRPPHPEDWRAPHPEDWRPPGWGPPDWGLEPVPPGPILPVPPVPPPDPAAYGPVPVPPPLGYLSFPPPGWTGQAVVEEAMLNPPPDQPEWIKALISAPVSESTPGESKNPTEEPSVTKTPVADPAAAPRPKPEPAKINRALGLLGKRTFDKPPPGRSTGIISFIGPSFGYIEREDLEKFTFSFAAFFGNPKAMTPGVRVHFTACKEKQNGSIATDVKVAPGGTENVDTEIYEAVVSQPIAEPQPGERQYPGQVHVDIGPLRTNLTFDRKDSTVTLLKNDQVLINLLTDIVSEKRRATNIKPQIPSTFSNTAETREQGVIVSLKDSEGVIKCDEHSELPFNVRENFSDIEFTDEDVNEEVEFTVATLRGGKRAIRIRRVKEPLLLTFSAATDAAEEAAAPNAASDEDFWLNGNAGVRPELGVNMKLDSELYEGIVSQPIIEPTPNMQGYPGQIHANIGPLKTNVTFDHRDCGVTLLKNDHVLINLLVDVLTGKRRAANIKPKIPFTFSYTKEKRELGIVTFLGPEEGIVNSEEHGELPFDICENFREIKFNSSDIHKEVEFTVAMVKSEKRAIRLLRTKRVEDQILEEQKKREEEEKKKKREEEERRKREEEERKRREEEVEERRREVERKKREEVSAALAAAKCKWTPLGLRVRNRDSLDDVSKERFQGTVLKAISKYPRQEIKKEPKENKGEQGGAQMLQVKIKVEKMDEDEKEEAEGKPEGEEREREVEEVKEDLQASPAAVKPDPEMGRLVMTIDGQQKLLPFGPNDLLSSATMLDGDKVRFNIATHGETKEERATFVEILPDSFEESIEQRRHGIVIEFSHSSGLIKCAQNPQLYFHMSEVIEKKRLELNEKVEFSVVPHETAEGGNQAIRIKRFTERVFLPVRKLGGVGANKGKMTIKLAKTEDTEKEKPETDKMKAVVKNLRTQDGKTSISRRDYRATQRKYGRSRSRSPPRDQFGRIIKKRRSTSADRGHKGSRYRRSRSRERPNRPTKSRTKSHSRSRSRSKSSSRSRSRSKERAVKKRRKTSREPEESHKRRRELSPPPRRGGIVDDELARKKRELEELNDMIAYKKSLVDIDPGQRTCIDYDHGRIAVPLTEYKPVRSILKKRPDGPDYLHSSQPYEGPYYEQPYSPYPDRRYIEHPVDPFASRPYTDRPYETRLFGEASYGGLPAASQRYTDRYDVYDEPYEDHNYDPAYADRPYKDPYRLVQRSQSPQPHDPLPYSQPSQVPSASTQPSLMNTAATSSSQPSLRPPPPTEPPHRSPSPTLENTTPRQAPPAVKQPLDRFLDMLNKKVDAEKKSEPVHVNDDLLPHERALQDGSGFSCIVGLAQEQPSSSLALEGKNTQLSPKRSSVERTSEEPKDNTEPYVKIQSLLRTIGLKLSTGDVSKLASRAQEKLYSPKSSSSERETLLSSTEERQRSRTGSVELDHIYSPSSTRSSSLEPLSRSKAVSEYEGFLDQQELEALQKAQQQQSLTKTMGSTHPTTSSPTASPEPLPAHYQHPPPLINWPLGVTTQIPPEQSSTTPSMGSPVSSAIGQPSQRFGLPPGPPPGPPPRRPAQPPPGPPPGPPPRYTSGQPLFAPPSSHTVFPFIGQPPAAPPLNSSSPLQPLITAAVSSTPTTSSPANISQSTISTTVARCLKVIETVKSLAVQPPAKPVKSVQFSLPTVPPSASSHQTSTEADDEIKNKQKEKLDLYNQRVLEKREQYYKDWLSRKNQSGEWKDGIRIFPGSTTGGAQEDSSVYPVT
ncbi:microtubule-associated protein 1B isoform X2 [Cyclopterus lumpus]|uniref:microtubule-associated protein 1B isoform X2 n=1 Tax=Cyclopterus lumpus TaxID=8103 RepID=UPI00148687C3|nr:microtubule-associated protein 1B isoform X2 [Cyclopterus lumpus]